MRTQVLYAREVLRLLNGKSTLVVRPNCEIVRRNLSTDIGSSMLVKESWALDNRVSKEESEVMRFLERRRLLDERANYGIGKRAEPRPIVVQVHYIADGSISTRLLPSSIRYHQMLRSPWHMPPELCLRTVELREHPRPNYLHSLLDHEIEQMGVQDVVSHWTWQQRLLVDWIPFGSWYGDRWWERYCAYDKNPLIWCYEVELVDQV